MAKAKGTKEQLFPRSEFAMWIFVPTQPHTPALLGCGLSFAAQIIKVVPVSLLEWGLFYSLQTLQLYVEQIQPMAGGTGGKFTGPAAKYLMQREQEKHFFVKGDGILVTRQR